MQDLGKPNKILRTFENLAPYLHLNNSVSNDILDIHTVTFIATSSSQL